MIGNRSIHAVRSRLRQIPLLRRVWRALRPLPSPVAPVSVVEEPLPAPQPAAIPALPRLERSGGPWVPSAARFRVLYVVRPGVWDAACMRYRGFNLVEALRIAGVEADFLDDREIPTRLAEALGYDLIVLVRRQASPEVLLLLDEARKLAIPTVCDLDDYLSDEEITPFVAMLKAMPQGQARAWVEQWRGVLNRCDFYTGSTRYLVERAALLGKPSFLIPNGFNTSQIALSRSARENVEQAPRTNVVKLGYFSGTRTHQEDFRQASAAIRRIMEDFPQVVLVVAGDFDLDEFPEFRQFPDRLVERPFLDWRMLPPEIASVDVNLVPLEVNLFTEGKSNLKYYEAAMVKVPTVATPSRSFAECITHGENGFLADGDQAWYDCLKALISSEASRTTIAERAYRHAMATYDPKVIASAAISSYKTMIRQHREQCGVPPDAPTVVVLIDDLRSALRQHSPAFTLAHAMTEAGAVVTLVLPETQAGGSASESRKWIEEHFSPVGFTVQVGGEIPCGDLMVATDAATEIQARHRAYRAGSVARLSADGQFLDSLAPKGQTTRLPLWVDAPPIAISELADHAPKHVVVVGEEDLPDSAWTEALAAFQRIEQDLPEVKIIPCGLAADRCNRPALGFLSGPDFDALIRERPICLALVHSDVPHRVLDLMAAGCPVVAATGVPVATPGVAFDEGVYRVGWEAEAIRKAIVALVADRVGLSALGIAGVLAAGQMASSRDTAEAILRSISAGSAPNSWLRGPHLSRVSVVAEKPIF